MESTDNPDAPTAESVHEPVAQAQELPALTLAGGWDTLFQGEAQRRLETDILPTFLRAQRWFGGKARRIDRIRIIDHGPLPGSPTPAFLAFLDVAYADGKHDLYFLPLAVATGAGAASLLELLRARVLARVAGSAGSGLLYDALTNADACSALLDAIGDDRHRPTEAGRVRAFPTAAFAELHSPADQPLTVRLGPQTSSNSLVFFGDRLLLKLFRRLEVGINPDFEVGRFLTEKSKFDRMPRVAGTIEYHRGQDEPITLAILQELIHNQNDGWSHALDELRRYFEQAKGSSSPPQSAHLHAAATLGRRTAQMHLALARDTHDPDFAPQPLDTADLDALAGEVRSQAEHAFSGLRDHAHALPESVASEGKQLLMDGPAAVERLARTPPVQPGSVVKTRCHGDYHLGQVLWVDGDFVLLDFEGEPTRSVAERRARQSPLKDVAGMLRSFDYAAHAGLFEATQGRPEDLDRLEPWARRWQQGTSEAFLREYLATAGSAPFLPREHAQLQALLDAFMLAKAFYELAYELNNRPDWVRIPLRGILTLLAAEGASGKR